MEWLEPSGRRIFGLMMATYRALLRKIADITGGRCYRATSGRALARWSM